MKFHLSLIALISFALFSFTTISGPDDKAARILQSSQKKLENLNDFTAKFSLAISNPNTGDRAPLPRQGTLKYAKGKYIILLKNQEIYCNKAAVWLYMKDMSEVEIMCYDPDESFNVESIFKIYEQSAKAQYRGTEVVGGKTCHKIYIAISDPNLDYNQATIWIDANSELPQKVNLKDRKQTTLSYKFANFKTNV